MVPVEFLSDEQAAGYGRFVGDPATADLERFCVLSDSDVAVIDEHRGDHSRLGFAVQLATVRVLGRFLPDALEVPWSLVEFIAGQLGVEDASVVKRYGARRATPYEHSQEITRRYGYLEASDPVVAVELEAFVASRAWLTDDGPVTLFDRSVAWLRDRKVLLPGVSVLARLVARVRAEQSDRLHDTIAELAGDRLTDHRLDRLVQQAGQARVSELETLRSPPSKTSKGEIVRQIERVACLRDLVEGIDLSSLPAARLRALARYGLLAKAGALRDLSARRRRATLIASLVELRAEAADDLGDALDAQLAERGRQAERDATTAQVREIPRLTAAAGELGAAVTFVLGGLFDESLSDAAFRDRLRTGLAIQPLQAAAAVVEQLAPLERRVLRNQELRRRSQTIRPFFVPLCASGLIGASRSAGPLVGALAKLHTVVSARHPKPGDLDLGVLNASWRPSIVVDGTLDRAAYVVALAEATHAALRRRELFIVGARRWGDPTARLLTGDAWRDAQPAVLAGLQLEEHPRRHLGALTAQLNSAYRRVEAQITDRDAALSVDGDGRFHLTELERLDTTESLTALRTAVRAMLPEVELPDLLMEVHEWTSFLDTFTHASEQAARLADLEVSVAAVLIAEACNVGFRPVIDENISALTSARLSHVDQNYVRAETLRAANARLVTAQATIPLARRWGGGLVASVDGMRFIVPVASVNTSSNPRYFGRKKGLTWLNYLNDQIAGISAVVVPGTVRDSLHVLDGLLNLDTGPQPTMIASDTASYSDQVFGLFALLGYRFSPRLADLPDQRVWTLDRATSFGGIDAVIRGNRINTTLIEDQWPDMLRLAGSLLTGTVKPSSILRVTQGGGRPTRLGRAIAEYGRIAKSLHVLAFVDSDDRYRRQIHTRLNTHESRHALARLIFHGRKGELRQHYREGQEDQLGALGLVLNAIVLWNTRYLDAAIEQLQGDDLDEALRLSPLGSEHINLAGRYHVQRTIRSALRPLRQPR